ncbi:hypothetical protein GUITHDRAFT_122468, partial [Guillardia theta CCMP2712]
MVMKLDEDKDKDKDEDEDEDEEGAMSSPAAAPPPLDNHRARDLGYRDAAHLQHEFEKAARIVRDDQDEMVREATSADKLRLYGYYKQ